MSYLSHQNNRKRAGSAEFVCMLVVLAAGAATFWWAGHKIGMDLSSLATAASMLGIRDTHPLRYDPRVATQPATIQVAGASAENAPQQQLAPYCTAGQVPAFVNGLGALKVQLGETMGAPVECEHPASAIGDTVQVTTTGLAAYTKLTNTVTFTDGWRHWALRGESVVTWEGTQSDPPVGLSAAQQ
ncbi:MAG TPA: hypothetical protein VGL99_11150 [Chloroflexota bacterium]|jgi:hypothetical protein